MIQVELEDAQLCADNYIKSSSPYPYFISTDGGEAYSKIVFEYLSGKPLRTIRTSDYCREDSYPDIDRLVGDIRHIEGNAMLLGVGESVSLGCSSSLLSSLFDLALPHKLIVVCKGSKDQIRQHSDVDRKFNERRYSAVKSSFDWSVVHIADGIPCEAVTGFKSLLHELENGRVGEIRARSSLPLGNVKDIRSCYMLLTDSGEIEQGYEDKLSDECWREYLVDRNLDNYEIRHWRTYLRMLLHGPESPYTELVMSRSATYDEYKKELYRAILHVPHDDLSFPQLYNERKRLLEGCSESDMADFVAVASSKGSERVHYLTDLTARERFAVIADIVKSQAVPDDLARVYHALDDYLSRYDFNCENGTLFTEYFEQYKRCKVLNCISPSFMNRVIMLAEDGNRPFNILDARNAVVESLYSESARLYWVDALGVEFLAYIQKLAERHGLSMSTHIARASLPTLTCYNRGFYENWENSTKYATKKLDSLIHEGEEDFNYCSEKLPVHIVKELEIIDEVLDRIAADLQGGNISSVILASDHGASRLAVINEHENKWEMQSKGTHSGRCCPKSDVDKRPDCAIEGNGHWALANYDRFKGGRKASVEVHGGASLEEVIVPVVAFSLRAGDVEIILDTDVVFTSYKLKPEVSFFCKRALGDATIRIQGKIYKAVSTGDGHYKATLDDISKAGEYAADVFEGDNRIGKISFTVKSQAAQVNDEDFFI